MPIYEICIELAETKSYKVANKLSDTFEKCNIISVIKVSESLNVTESIGDEKK
jgi:hypothetical protein